MTSCDDLRVDKQRGGRIRMRDVAEHAGVSVRTVSNVVNDHIYVSVQMRERVQASLDELGYKMDYVARSLRSGRTGMVALVVPQLAEPYFAELAQAVIRAASRRRLIVLIESSDNDPDTERRVMKGALSTVADGVLLSAAAAVVDDPPDVPLVLLGEHTATHHGDHVGIDNVAAARTVTEHLLAQGFRHVLALGVNDTTTAQQRDSGYREALREAGIRPKKGLTLATSDWSPQGGYEQVDRYLRAGRLPPAEAIFAFNDSLALGALRALREHGITVPSQMAVAGIDDIAQSAFVEPTLTTIAPNLDEIAETALESLFSQINGVTGRREYRRRVTSFQLKVRESTVRPHAI